MRREERLYITLDAVGAVDRALFIADTDFELLSVQYQFVTASTSGTLTLRSCSSGTAVGSGTAMLASTLDLSAAKTANTPYTGTLAVGQAARKIPKGYALGLDFGGTVTNLVGLCVTIVLQRQGAGIRS